MPNLIMLGAVDQGIEATKVGHATDRVTLSIGKRQLNRMQYEVTRMKEFVKLI
jgi:hypothetical protein